MSDEKMMVVMVEPNKPAYITEIGRDLKSLQAAVGGYIEIAGFLPDADIVCNEEAKLCGMEGNRRFGSSIIAGPFFICGTKMTEDGEDFDSLPDELCEKYLHEFAEPDEITQDEVQADMCARIMFF